MKNKGFTLVELLAVLVILAILLVIAIPSYINVFSDIKRDSFISKVSELETAALKYGSSIKDEIKTSTCKDITIEELIKNGLINSDSQYRNEILNPTTNKPLTGKIMICYSNANLDIVANYVVPYEQNKIYYKEDKVYVGNRIYKCLSTINTKNYSINSLSQFELIYG